MTQKLADIVNKRWTSKLEDHHPENCDKLSVAKVNPEILCKLNHDTKTTDLRVQNLQKTLVKAESAMT